MQSWGYGEIFRSLVIATLFLEQTPIDKIYDWNFEIIVEKFFCLQQILFGPIHDWQVGIVWIIHVQLVTITV